MSSNACLLPSCALAISLAVAALAPPSSADVSSISGGDLIAPPSSVEEGALEHDTLVHVFEERTLTLGADLHVDVTVQGTYGASLTPGSIPAGTEITSHFVHADQVGTGGSTVLTATITFSEPILGILFSDALLDASDAICGASGTSYPTGVALRGLNTAGVDVVSWTASTVQLTLPIYFVTDQLRVLTAPTSDELAFSLDIGSDVEFSDPSPDGNEEIDPGDIVRSSASTTIDVIWDDMLTTVYGADPFPSAPYPLPYGGGCPSPGPPTQYHQTFDLDAFELTDLVLDGMLPGPIPEQNVAAGDIPRIGALLISFDDDRRTGWLCSAPVPTTSTSPAGQTYGSTALGDEVLRVELSSGSYPLGVSSITPHASESELHAALAPNPSVGQMTDDDVDGLDHVGGGSQVLYSVDVEADNLLFGGAIYLSGGGAVVGPADLGLGFVDIDAFAFAWLPAESADPEGPQQLALLFSVDDDDSLTSPDESGGLDPARIYASFLDGSHFALTGSLGDDVDAIAVEPRDASGGDGTNRRDQAELTPSGPVGGGMHP